ncbi:hypothetical protein BKA82DRAFT_9093, partial [Pisolithus tinctorius]
CDLALTTARKFLTKGGGSEDWQGSKSGFDSPRGNKIQMHQLRYSSRVEIRSLTAQGASEKPGIGSSKYIFQMSQRSRWVREGDSAGGKRARPGRRKTVWIEQGEVEYNSLGHSFQFDEVGFEKILSGTGAKCGMSSLSCWLFRGIFDNGEEHANNCGENNEYFALDEGAVQEKDIDTIAVVKRHDRIFRVDHLHTIAHVSNFNVREGVTEILSSSGCFLILQEGGYDNWPRAVAIGSPTAHARLISCWDFSVVNSFFAASSSSTHTKGDERIFAAFEDTTCLDGTIGWSMACILAKTMYREESLTMIFRHAFGFWPEPEDPVWCNDPPGTTGTSGEANCCAIPGGFMLQGHSGRIVRWSGVIVDVDVDVDVAPNVWQRRFHPYARVKPSARERVTAVLYTSDDDNLLSNEQGFVPSYQTAVPDSPSSIIARNLDDAVNVMHSVDDPRRKPGMSILVVDLALLMCRKPPSTA